MLKFCTQLSIRNYFHTQFTNIRMNIGANVDARDAVGRCAFEYIRDYEEWIQSGHFSTAIISRLRGVYMYSKYCIRQKLSILYCKTPYFQKYYCLLCTSFNIDRSFEYILCVWNVLTLKASVGNFRSGLFYYIMCMMSCVEGSSLS